MTVQPLGIDPDRCFIANEWMAPANGETLELSNPSDGTTLCAIARGTGDDIDSAVNAAQAARKGEWGRFTAAERGRCLTRMGQLVLEHVEDLAQLEALDVGKPLTQARADAKALARYLEFYGGAADKVHGATIPYLEGYTV
ncbi:MAG: aldehyde dehydrogenase family protein, partial [Boseongicola sp.]